MRKVLILFFAVFLFSCNKDSDCYKCKTTITINIKEAEESYTWSASDTRTKCDATEAEIKEYEINNTDTITYINGTVTVDTVIITVCKK
jgi:hypothetical protein